MLISIDQVLTKDEVRQFRPAGRRRLGRRRRHRRHAGWMPSKHNQQIDDRSELCQRLGQQILRRLGATPAVHPAALPRTIYPPKFNRYADGGTYGAHVGQRADVLPGKATSRCAPTSHARCSWPSPGIRRRRAGGGRPVRRAGVKLGAGDMVLYPRPACTA